MYDGRFRSRANRKRPWIYYVPCVVLLFILVFPAIFETNNLGFTLSDRYLVMKIYLFSLYRVENL